MAITHEDNHPRRTTPFILGGLTLIVDHQTAITVDSLNSWLQELNQKLMPIFVEKHRREYPGIVLLNEPLLHVIPLSLDKVTQSLIHLSLQIPNLDTKELVNNLDADTIKTVNLLNEPLPEFINKDITLVSAAPNWIFGGSKHTIYDGGPGGRPVEVPAPATKGKVEFNTIPTQAAIDDATTAVAANPALAAKQSQVETSVVSTGRDVNVVILDTAPTDDELSAIDPTHAIWNTLRNKLTVIHASDMRISLPPIPTPINDVHYIHKDAYKMSDHGSFIAGTVHTCSPEAKIYLVEALNAYGVGSTDTIVRAIAYIIQNVANNFTSGSALIVNCSLCIGFKSFEELVKLGLNPHADSDAALGQSPLLQPIRDAFDTLKSFCAARNIDLRITAAAGNDGVDPNLPVAPRYPAAFPDVICVGSCDDASNRSWYSNTVHQDEPDKPNVDGVLVFGGKSAINNAGKSESDTIDGMLGMYIGKYPSGKQSDGWARWSGTSFATGLMSGILAKAAVDGVMISQNAAKDFITSFKKEAKHTSLRGEKIVFTQQG